MSRENLIFCIFSVSECIDMYIYTIQCLKNQLYRIQIFPFLLLPLHKSNKLFTWHFDNAILLLFFFFSSLLFISTIQSKIFVGLSRYSVVWVYVTGTAFSLLLTYLCPLFPLVLSSSFLLCSFPNSHLHIFAKNAFPLPKMTIFSLPTQITHLF